MSIHYLRLRLVVLILSLTGTQPHLQAAPEAVDRGPTFSGTIRAKFPGDNVTMKGVVVALGTDTNAFICYDTDLMRVSLAWTGDYLRFGNYMREIVHPQPPEVAGTPVFGTQPGPGWAKSASFVDPRSGHQGPLPRDWAKYRGLYLHERQVVFSYMVGKAKVLEMPGLERIEGIPVFTRTLQLKDFPGGQVLICEPPRGTSQLVSEPQMLVFNDRSMKEDPEFVVAVVGDTGAILEQMDGRLITTLSGRSDAVQILMMRASEGSWRKLREQLRTKRKFPELKSFTKGGPSRWRQPVVTQGALATSGDEGPYVVDTITEPVPNPWKANTFFGGFDFFPDGRAAICTFHGDVWVISGIDAKLENLTWRRFATGLFQPLGLKVVDERIYVTGRDQITRLHDLNEDGEADFYENFNNDTVVTANYHEFCMDLQTDRAGNFYYAKGSPWTPDVRSPHQGTMLKVSKDGSRLDVFATGLRAPNGAGMGPGDQLTVSDNQGHWMPASKLNLVKKGGFYGMTPAAQKQIALTRGGTNLVINPSDPFARAQMKVSAYDSDLTLSEDYDQPICWLPMNIDNSSGGQVWASTQKWGPLKDRLLFMSYGRGSLFLVMSEEVNGITQAGMVRLPLRFGTGLMRGRVNPKDGQVYLCGLRGWQTDGTKDGGFYRVRYTEASVHMPVELHAMKDGLQIKFTGKLDRASASDVANYSIEQWNYVYSGKYGSPELSVNVPAQKRHDRVEVRSARVAKDGVTVLLEIADIRPVNQMKIKLAVKAADGTVLNQEIYNTIHTLGSKSIGIVK